MTISLELSMVKHNSGESARLAAAMDFFLLGGGKIHSLEYGITRPVGLATPYSSPRGEAAAKTDAMQRQRITPDIEEATAKSEARIKKPKVITEEELKLVARVKAMRDLGVTRKQAAKHMQISDTLMTRLIADHAIDYPKAVNRFK
jgi:hypothetical protein